MNVRVKTAPDDTRARIIDAADELFRRLGFAKTAVADIAAALNMSPANVYRFFPSKHAIVEAICARCVGELEEKLWAIARSKEPAPARLERLVVEVLRYHRDNLLTEKQVNDIVLVALEHSWKTIEAHKEKVRHVIELILRDGIADGAFEPVDPKETAQLFLAANVRYCHPVLIAENMSEDLEMQARASARFVMRAFTPRS